MEREAADLRVANCLTFFALALLYYDHAVTFVEEVNFIWAKRFTLSSFLFILNRYAAFFGNLALIVVKAIELTVVCRGVVDLFTLVLSLGTPQLRFVLSSCRKFGLFHQMLLVVNQVLVCGLLTVRIYALYNRSLRTLAYLLLSAAVLGAICAWALSDQDVHVEKTSCEVSLSKITSIRVATAWEALFIYDSIIFYFTIRRTWETWRSHSFRFTASSMPVVNLVLRDGAIYFAVMALATLSNIITFYVTQLRLRGSLSTFASSISLIMVSRLMLNLHKSSHVGIFSTEPSIYLTTQFAPCDIESNCNTTTNNDTIYSPSATISG